VVGHDTAGVGVPHRRSDVRLRIHLGDQVLTLTLAAVREQVGEIRLGIREFAGQVPSVVWDDLDY
jgi:hypothetical protein